MKAEIKKGKLIITIPVEVVKTELAEDIKVEIEKPAPAMETPPQV